MIDIRQMRYFVVLAETLHFGRAAARLHLTQPPLSRQIALLETELGVRLLDRHSRNVSLTAAGRRFLEDSKAVLAAFDQACHNARLADRGEMGRLSIGFMGHAALTVVPSLARRYIAAYPKVELKLREIIPSTLVDEILAGRYDAGIMFTPGAARDLETWSIHREKLCAAIYPSHRLASRKRVDARDLDGEPLIVTPSEVSPGLREAIDGYFRAVGLSPNVRLETQLQQTIVSLVAEGLGVALVPQSASASVASAVSFVELDNAPAVEHVIAWRTDNMNPALGPLLELAGVPSDKRPAAIGA